MQISDCWCRRGAKKAPLAKHRHHLTLAALQLKEMKKIHRKGEGRKTSLKDQKPLNENVCKTQQAEKRIGSKTGKPFPWVSLKPQTLAQKSAKAEWKRFGGATTCTALLPREPKDVLSTHSSLQQENSKHFMEKQTTRICHSTARATCHFQGFC